MPASPEPCPDSLCWSYLRGVLVGIAIVSALCAALEWLRPACY